MKGITHFTVGVALASCFPEAVRAGSMGDPLYFLCGGVLGLLPDTLDFRFVRFLYPHHIEIAPDPAAPDPALVADGIRRAAESATLTQRAVRLKLNSMPVGENRWQRYTVHFDVGERAVRVNIGDIVDNGGNPVAAPPLPRSRRTGMAALKTDVHVEYLATTEIDIFDGPVFLLSPTRNGAIAVRFIPWHREWTHSIPLAAALGLALGAATNWTAGAIAASALSAHGLVDHMGQLGVNLLFPFQKQRRHGLGWLRSTHALGNFALTWAASLLVFWNLYRQAGFAHPAFTPGLFVAFALVPCVVLRSKRYTRKAR